MFLIRTVFFLAVVVFVTVIIVLFLVVLFAVFILFLVVLLPLLPLLRSRLPQRVQVHPSDLFLLLQRDVLRLVESLQPFSIQTRRRDPRRNALQPNLLILRVTHLNSRWRRYMLAHLVALVTLVVVVALAVFLL